MSTEQPRPLQGYREVKETKRDVPVDPKKFQEELSKVQQSDESQQQGKRNLKKSEEEIEEDSDQNNQPTAPSGDLFSLFMSDENRTSVMSPQTPQNVRSTQAPSSSSTFNIEEDSSPPGMKNTQAPEVSMPGIAPIGNPQAPSSSSAAASKPSSETYPSQEEPVTTPLDQTLSTDDMITYPETQDNAQIPSNTQSSSQESPQRVKKKETEDNSLLSNKHPSSAQLLKKKKETTPEIKLEKAEVKAPTAEKTLPTEQPEKAKEKKPLQNKASSPPEKPPKLSTTEEKPEVSQVAKETYLQKEAIPGKVEQSKQPLTAPLVDKKKLDEKSKEQPLTESTGGLSVKTESSNEHKDKKEEKESEDSSSISQTTTLTPFTPQVAPEAPAYATLPTQVYELFERMVGVMRIEEHNGVSTTTVTINMKNSVFDGAKIVLDHYNTAPNCFNVTIQASPDGQKLINDNIGDLVAAFQQSKLSFEVNMRRPILLKEYQAFERKEKVGEEDSNQQGQ